MATSAFFNHLDSILNGNAPLGVCHVGAHKGQEVELYREAGFGKIILVEPSPRLALGLIKRHMKDPIIRIIPVAISSKPEIRKFYWTNWDQHRSLLQPTDGTERFLYVPCLPLHMVPEIVNCNMLVMDIQGGELAALKGAKFTTGPCKNIRAIVCEVRADTRYKNCPTEKQIVSHLSKAGFSVRGKWGGVHANGVFDMAFVR